MAASTDLIRSILKDVALTGAVALQKRKLLYLIGWGQDRPTAWADLLGHWTAIGEAQGDLHGIEVGEMIVLTANPGDQAHEPVTAWA